MQPDLLFFWLHVFRFLRVPRSFGCYVLDLDAAHTVFAHLGWEFGPSVFSI